MQNKRDIERQEWVECPPFANGLIEGIFFPFKTPRHDEESTFTVQTVLNHSTKNNWRIGLWFDLTNTDRYYSGSDVEANGVKYVKLLLRGKCTPSRLNVNSFITECNRFLVKNPGQVIGVHCTHGFNRTGYLICAFLARIKKYDVFQALEKFAEIRPPGIYRQYLVDEFVQEYSSSWRQPTRAIPQVTKPSWDKTEA